MIVVIARFQFDDEELAREFIRELDANAYAETAREIYTEEQ